MARTRGDAMRTTATAVVGGLVTGLVLLATGALGIGGATGAAGPGATDVRALYRAAAPSVVAIAAEDRTGSGFLIDAHGDVVTNAHVVGEARSVEVTIGGRTMGALVRGVEPSVDIAVLRLEGGALEVAPLVFGDAPSLRVGDPVVAIGAPFGLQGSLSTGVVSGLRRQIDSPNGFAITGVIQTDAALNPGNSGGPLLDLSGRVVGVATQIATEGGRNEGIGFAVPADVVRRTVERIIATGEARLPYLGVAGEDVGDGVRLERILADGPAVGVLRPDDVITAVDGRAVMSNAGLASALAGRAPGESVEVTVRRGEASARLDVRLAARPASLSG